MIRLARAPDLPRIVDIYNAAIPTRRSTADLEPVSVRSRVAWFAVHTADRRPIWVAEVDGAIAGWLSISDYYGRPAYATTVEVGVYLAPEAQGRGLGRALLAHAIAAAPALGVRTMLWITFAENAASTALAHRFGFAQWGLLPRVTETQRCAPRCRHPRARTGCGARRRRGLLAGDRRDVVGDRLDLRVAQTTLERRHAAITVGHLVDDLLLRRLLLVEVRADVAVAAAGRQRVAADAPGLLEDLRDPSTPGSSAAGGAAAGRAAAGGARRIVAPAPEASATEAEAARSAVRRRAVGGRTRRAYPHGAGSVGGRRGHVGASGLRGRIGGRGAQG